MENMILQPIVVGGQTFKNRIMFPPLTTGYEKNGMISEQDMGFYTRLAKGGVGYIVLGDVAPINSFSPTPKLFDDSQIPAFKALADSVHAYGTKLGVQLCFQCGQVQQAVEPLIHGIQDVYKRQRPHSAQRR